jgi:sensor c-di-GMP phosphodiesterase-like protein
LAKHELFLAIRPKLLSSMQSRFLKRALLLVAVAVLGAQIAREITSVRQERAERRRLLTVASAQIDQGLHLGLEARSVLQTLSVQRYPVCSTTDLSFMRNTIANSAHIWDAGRERSGKILCSVLEGVIHPAFSVGAPNVIINGNQIWLYPWPLTPPRHQGFIIESSGAWVVLDQEILDSTENAVGESTTTYLHDKTHNTMIRSTGVLPALSVAETVSNRFIERNGVMYQPLCVDRSAICAVTAERRSTFLARGWTVLWLWTAIGGLIGTCVTGTLFMLDSRQRTLEARLRRAIRGGALRVVYQPIVDIVTEEIVGAEALVRWKSDAGDFVPPDVFIPLAERKGLIGAITRVVVNLVLKEMGESLAMSRFRITINISSYDLMNPLFLPDLDRRMDRARIPRSSIGLELTERSTADRVLVAEAIARLRQAGHSVYIDDFGTGYSSLAYLHELCVDFIKIDRSFTKMIGTEAVAASVVPQILGMALRLNLQVVVEGIETRAQADYFRENMAGAHGQGWLYSKPVDAALLRRLIRADQRWPAPIAVQSAVC